MKKINSPYMAAMTFAALAAAVPVVQAQTILAPAGVNLGLTGEIIQSPVIHEPSDNAVGWSQTGWNFANRIVPVGQFMGFEDDGTAIPFLDLIPLRTNKVEIRDAGSGVFEPAATKPEFLSAAGNGNTFTAVTFSNFANAIKAYSSPTGSITYTATTIVLKPGKSYRLTFSPQTYTSFTTANGFCYYQWENMTAGTILGTGLASSPGFATYTTSVAPLEEIVTPTVVTTYRIKLTPAYATSQALGGNIIVQTL